MPRMQSLGRMEVPRSLHTGFNPPSAPCSLPVYYWGLRQLTELPGARKDSPAALPESCPHTPGLWGSGEGPHQDGAEELGPE